MRDAAALLTFAGFVLGALGVLVAGRRAPTRPAVLTPAVHLFIAFTLTASLLAGLTQRDLWPFAHWRLAAGLVEPGVSRIRVLGVDAVGREHAVDARAWRPLSHDELIPWLEIVFPRLSHREQAAVGAWLLTRAEEARIRASSGRSLDPILGPLSAPTFVLHPRRWSDAASVPPSPFVRVRLRRMTWALDRPAEVESVTLGEYPPP